MIKTGRITCLFKLIYAFNETSLFALPFYSACPHLCVIIFTKYLAHIKTPKMKNSILPFILCIVCLSFTSDVLSQNYWKGGTPGNETNWNTPRNWSQNQVPDWSESVIIPDVSTQSGYFPVISETIEPIPHIEIQGNALLTVLAKGRLVIDGETTINCGILLNGKIISNGDIDIVNVAYQEIDKRGGEILMVTELLAGN